MRSSAPGKVILFGEHAVVYGRPALAVPVHEVRAEVDVTPSPRPGVWIEAPDIRLVAELESLPADDPLAVSVRNLRSHLGMQKLPDLLIRISSSIPVASGLGSGAAVAVALTRAVSGSLGAALTDEDVNALAFEVEKLHHGTPSGIDNAVITFARPVYFVKGQPMQMLRVREPFTVVIGFTGIAASTRAAVADVRRLWQSDPPHLEVIFEGIGAIARMAREAIETGMWRHLGPLMNENHSLLQRLTVSSADLDRLVLDARRAGALGAKLSGGGRGGNMIALAPASGPQAIADALVAAGASRVIITTVQASG